jgi:hypothetical protein
MATEWELVISSLQYTRQAFEAYSYPTPELRQERLAAVDEAIAAVREIKRQQKGAK